ncbi:ATP-dependent helicase [Nitrospirillum pindoramense]|uniref:ATP-dependent helicase n=1 Tax=Nitrospirillum amazonense TaxID=28077 RepID=UPI001FE4CB68|nr:ATP-dependent helicase [Nitrospirillum amazonense]
MTQSTAPSTETCHLDELNADQRRAAEHGPGPLLVIAGAGSGKTKTIVHRVVRLIETGVDPRRILLLTFSRRAAAEIARRVEQMAARLMGQQSIVVADALAGSGTFHAVGARLLREFAEEIGLDPSFTIHDREDSADLMNIARHELGYDKTETRFPTKGACLAIYSRVVNAEANIKDVLARAFPQYLGWVDELPKLFGAYVESKQAQGVLDYDDLLLYWARMMEEPSFAAAIAERYDHILVDEYQDTNLLQATILKALKPDGRGLAVVGDDAQSIYAFRAATVRNILDFPGGFDPPATVVTLARNYRSTQPILSAANAVIGLAPERFTKDLWTERKSGDLPRLVTVPDETAQAHYVADKILEGREAGTPLISQAVLFRTAHHSGPLEVEMVRRNIPFRKFGGLKFLDAAHVRDVLAVLRWVQNPRDRLAGFRALQLMRGVGPKAAASVLDLTAGFTGMAGLEGHVPPARAAEDWPAFLELVGRLSGHGAGWPTDMELVRTWYEPHLERLHEDAQPRLADLRQLEQIAAGFASREQFLTDLTLDPPDAVSDEAGVPRRDDDYVILSTIHSAKGQEYKRVFVLNAVDGCIPSDLGVGCSDDLEEERRLLYVAMTRAKDSLHLVMPHRFYVTQQAKAGDRHLFAARTRFIPKAILPLFESRAWAPAPPPDAAPKPRPAGKVDLGAKMRGMWR